MQTNPWLSFPRQVKGPPYVLLLKPDLYRSLEREKSSAMRKNLTARIAQVRVGHVMGIRQALNFVLIIRSSRRQQPP